MRIGILTFHRAENFGAVLQCFALQEYLRSKKYEVKIIDYRCRAIENAYYLLNIRILFRSCNIVKSFYLFFKRSMFFFDKWRKKTQYRAFRNRMFNRTSPMININKNMGYDAYIVGSDQVWNTLLTGGFDKNYFLEFPMSENAIKIAYAVSSEENAILDLNKYKTKVIKALCNFDAISVREQSFSDALSKYTKKRIQVCCDPTFFLSKAKYISIAKKPKDLNYVLVYHVKESEDASQIADALSQKLGLKVIEIHASFSKWKDRKRHYQNLGPLEILGYMVYAKYIITTSFHGVALSLILEKQFYITSKEANLRQINLLKYLGLQNRIISSTPIDMNSQISYIEVNNKIKEMVVASQNYILKNLLYENCILDK